MQQWRQGDPGVVQRLEKRYELLRDLIIEFRKTLPDRDPEAAQLAPSVDVYLAALELETSGKTLEQMIRFVDDELMKPLSNLSKDHPVRAGLQRRYVTLAQALLPQIVERIQQGEDFDSLLEFLAASRHVIAEEACDLPSYEFGRPRLPEHHCITRSPLHRGGWFEAYLDTVLALVPPGTKEGVFPPAFARDVGAEWETIFDSVTVWAELSEETIPMSVYAVCREPTNSIKADWLFSELWVSPLVLPAAAIVHTDPVHFPVIKRHCRQLYEQICSGEFSQKELLALLAEFHWYLAHATFFRRGSASIAEWLLQALFAVKGIQVKWKRPPDLQALLTTRLKQFIELYPSLIERPQRT
jgi:hypothetical protein